MDDVVSPPGFGPEALRAAVRERYAEVATNPEPGYTFRVGREFAEDAAAKTTVEASKRDDTQVHVFDVFNGIGFPKPPYVQE